MQAPKSLSKLTIRNGFAKNGGGIYNKGTLAISNTAVSGNIASVSCVKVCHASGGGIFNGGSLTINNSTVSGNNVSVSCYQSCGSDGGGISNDGTLTINNSTLSGNRATVVENTFVARGGGISNGGSLTINNSTLSGNDAYGRVIYGGGIFNNGGATLQNTIVANSPSGGNCSASITSKGYNLSDDNTCNFHGSGDRNNTDPKLGGLQNNGGPTQTMALLPGSPAIDTGNPSGCKDGQGHLLKTDQRGMPRPDKEDSRGCDMGAYERQTD